MNYVIEPRETSTRLNTTTTDHLLESSRKTSNMPARPLTKAQRMSYRIGRGETGVLTFEPYKSEILPLWRFKTPVIAKKSSSDIYAKFLEYDNNDDFVGMDMSRKFLQMGMTRAKRYANHAGGRKYDKKTGEELEKSKGHAGMEEKLEASEIFKEVWQRAKEHEGYIGKKERFMKEQKEWDKIKKKEAKIAVKEEEETEVKDEEVEAEVKEEEMTEVKKEETAEIKEESET
jgi:hypothetical protein